MNWKPIPETCQSYSASDTGEIRRDKPVKGHHKAGQCLAQGEDRYGYKQTSISVSGRQRTVTVHRLVALAFLGDPPPDKPQINHKNGVKTDNRPENLEWCSVGHNIRHAFALGLNTARSGEASTSSKLTEDKAAEILSRKRVRGLGVVWAREFGVTPGAISMLLKRKTWKHLHK
jgi:hypothetical protein